MQHLLCLDDFFETTKHVDDTSKQGVSKKKTRARRKFSTLVLIHHFKCMNKETKATKLGV
jgi:hypothetical protein